MSLNSRSKGKAGELELARELNKLLGTESYRSQQFCGTHGDADIAGIPGLHVECKRVEKLNIHKAIEKAVLDSSPEDTPIVCHRRNRTEWLVTLRMSDLPDLARKILSLEAKTLRLQAKTRNP